LGNLPFKVAVHPSYLGQANQVAVEFAPRFGELRYWCIAFPAGSPIVNWGVGPSGGAGVGGNLRESIKGTVMVQDESMQFVGAGDVLTPGTAAYAVFATSLPGRLAFGWTNEAYSIPEQWWVL
jgi:hypothetical protein